MSDITAIIAHRQSLGIDTGEAPPETKVITVRSPTPTATISPLRSDRSCNGSVAATLCSAFEIGRSASKNELTADYTDYTDQKE
jgi:hypothetical protein